MIDRFKRVAYLYLKPFFLILWTLTSAIKTMTMTYTMLSVNIINVKDNLSLSNCVGENEDLFLSIDVRKLLVLNQ